MAAAAFHVVGSWHGPLHLVWNSVALVLELLYVIVVVRIPRERFAHGQRSKAWWIVGGLAPAAYGLGLFVPVGVLVAWPWVVIRFRRAPVEVGRGNGAEAYSFYPQRPGFRVEQ